MNKKLLFTLLMLVCAMLPAAAYEFEGDLEYTVELDQYNSVTYLLNSENKTASLKKFNYHDDAKGKTKINKFDIPGSVNYNGETYTIIYIGISAFENNTNLTAVTLPKSIEFVGAHAFYGCVNLTGDLYLSDNLTTIDSHAFAYTNFKRIRWGKNILQVVTGGFYGVKNASIYFEDEESLKAWCDVYFWNIEANPLHVSKTPYFYLGDFDNAVRLDNLVIPEGVEKLDYYTLYNLEVESLTLPTTLTEAKSSCLSKAEIGTLIIPGGMQAIPDGLLEDSKGKLCVGSVDTLLIESGDKTLDLGKNKFPFPNIIVRRNVTFSSTYSPFYDTTKIHHITIGGKATTLPDKLFYRSTGVYSLSFEDDCQLATIGDWCFYEIGSETWDSSIGNFHEIELIELPESLTYIGEGAFSWTMINEIIIPGNAEIGKEAFKNSRIKKVTLQEGMKIIGSYAFYAEYPNTYIYEINIPSTIEKIGSYAFACIDGIKEVNFRDNRNLKTIGSYAFYECSNLEKVDLHECRYLESIGKYAFAYCPKLETVDLYDCDDLASLGSYAFYKCGNLKSVNLYYTSDLETIPSYCFAYCSSLETVNLSSNTENINSYAFYKCSNLSNINLALTHLEIVGDYAFYGCSSITEIKPTDTYGHIESIGNYAFSNCTGLTSVSFSGNTHLTIGNYAFNQCTALTDAKFDAYIESIGDNAFASTSLQNLYLDWLLSYFQAGENPFPNDGEGIALEVWKGEEFDFAMNPVFQNFDSINGYELEEGVMKDYTYWPPYSNETDFYVYDVDLTTTFGTLKYDSRYPNRTSMEIPGVAKNSFCTAFIAAEAYIDNTLLTSLTLPKYLQGIGDAAFANSDLLEEITIYATIPPAMGEGVFNEAALQNAILLVPAGSVEAYQTAEGWSEFANIAPQATVTATHINLYVNGEPYTGPVDVEVGSTLTITAETYPDNTTYKDVYFAVTDGEDLLYTSPFNGQVVCTPQKVGTYAFVVGIPRLATVTGGCVINVVPVEATSISIETPATDLNLYVGDQVNIQTSLMPFNVTDTELLWASSDPNVAIVENGVVTATGYGTAEIIATTVNGLSDSCTVTVNPYIATFYFTGAEGNEWSDQKDYNPGDEIILPEIYVPLGYIFSGWTGLPANGVMPAENVNIYGSLIKEVFTLTYSIFTGEEDEEGNQETEEVESVELTYGEEIPEFEAPAVEGYTFYGWYGLPANNLMPAEDLTVYGLYVSDDDLPTGIEEIESVLEGRVDVYSINGQLIQRNIELDSLKNTLAKGLYIVVGNNVSKKVFVR
ncbi:MAG: leucine-rich repeat protein [Muribaculaceae bacterium]|nr:leucine-rich repeat protein [Muribaculaceae bacterium]